MVSVVMFGANCRSSAERIEVDARSAAVRSAARGESPSSLIACCSVSEALAAPSAVMVALASSSSSVLDAVSHSSATVMNVSKMARVQVTPLGST